MKWQRSRIPSSAASPSRLLRSGPSPTSSEVGVASLVAEAREGAQQIVRALDLGHAAEPADEEAVVRHAELATQLLRRPGRGREPLVEVEPEPDDGDLLRRSDAERDEVVADLRARRRSARRCSARTPARPSGRPRSSPARNSRAGRGRGTCGRPPSAGRDPASFAASRPDRAGLRGVRVEDVRTEPPNQGQELAGGTQIVERRDLPLQRRQVDGRDPELLRDVLHRALAAPDRACDERRLVPDPVELPRQIGDVQRRPADVEAGDDAKDPDRLRRGHRNTVREPSGGQGA